MDMNILIVDDDNVLRKELSELLGREGYDAKSVGSGEEAIKLLKNQDFKLIFTDLKMPGMSGIEVLKEVKRLKPNIHMVMITAYGTIDTAIEAMKIGADDYIRKPFEMKQLQSVIENVNKTMEFKKQISGLTKAKKVNENDPFEQFRTLVQGTTGMCITRQNPKMIKERYDLKDVFLLWLNPEKKCDSCIDPKNIYELKLTISSFFRENPKGVVLLEGLEVLLKQHPWDDIRKFMEIILNMALLGPSQLLISINPNEIDNETLEDLKNMIGSPYVQLISDSISSPIRRRIIRFLSNQGSSSFSGILKELKLRDAPKLSFHLKRLANDKILQKDQKKSYTLTDRGKSVSEHISLLENEVVFDIRETISLILRNSES